MSKLPNITNNHSTVIPELDVELVQQRKLKNTHGVMSSAPGNCSAVH